MDNKKCKLHGIFEEYLTSDLEDIIDEDDENFNTNDNRVSKTSGRDIKTKKHKTKKNKKSVCPAASKANGCLYVLNMVQSKVTFNCDRTRPQDISSGWQTKIERDHLIDDVMDSKVKLSHEYGDCIAKNMGKNWPNTFRAMGYNQGKIETSYLDWINYGLGEVRYQLLLDWVRNDEEGTLGKIATVLWNEGEREVVKLLSVIYKNNKKENEYPIANPGPSRAAR